jgi:hypothetical protein
VTVGARFLLFAVIVLLSAHHIGDMLFVPQMGEGLQENALWQPYLVDGLYALGIVTGGLGAIEAGLKIMFGKDKGQLAFMTVLAAIFVVSWRLFSIFLPGKR